jgi:hypothetical protein
LEAQDLAVKRLLWDFFGPHRDGTAEHFERHLREFLARNGLEREAGCETGLEAPEGNRRTVFCQLPAAAADRVAQALRAKRFIDIVP